MKTLLMTLLFLVVVETGWTKPQQFHAPVNPGTPKSTVRSENQDGTLRPIPTGAFYMMSRYGIDAVSPWARRSMGVGQSVLTQRVSHENHRGGDADRERDFGGMRLIGFAF